MNKKQFLLSILLASVIGGLVALAGVSLLTPSEKVANFEEKQNTSFVNWLNNDNFNIPDGINFVASASQVTPAVVHIRSTVTIPEGRRGGNPLEEFFDFRYPDRDGQGPMREGRSSGSGVIISKDGYIVTNNHVIENAKEISVTLHDNTRYRAKIIGTDPTTDLALLKIEAEKLPFVPFGDSDKTKVGEWVLAVGNPFDLTSTVTAGIVSAKARNIGILRSESNNNLQIESFIQTDAVVNRGNSGGALVNLAGELIGINTAIASQTGTFNGYAFAVPSSIVKKVMDDLLEYGAVQRGLLGIQIQDISPELEDYLDKDFSVSQGVYVAEVNEGSGGEEAGLESGDIIIGVDGKETNSVSRLQELVARKRPGDQVEVKFLRNGKEHVVKATLKNISGTTKVVKREEPETADFESVTFEDLEVGIKQRLNLDGGAVIIEVDNDKWKEAGAREGFIITYVGREKILSAKDLKKALSNAKGKEIMVLGIYPNGQRSYFEITLDN
ncbi:Do family serine endopeptidase [Echinicola jeungdonensis]|uniref:Do family serine endopeptidase n=1 Tax=Echinicola jeungdonensis TaxID=709343 RepID=A0ABV5J3C7_9BACT|nr:Do family serine endopeptidase [Echinicola jeungdonensis]MDN3668526.1 Do family serine endopeptidase [Echinicola jeungdonensis]